MASVIWPKDKKEPLTEKTGTKTDALVGLTMDVDPLVKIFSVTVQGLEH